MKKILLLIAMISLPTFAGTKDSGGDPMSQQFIEYGFKLAEYYQLNPYKLPFTFSADDFKQQVLKLDASIKDESAMDLIEFTAEKLTDKSGIEKPAVFNIENGLIRVNRDVWINFSTEERLVQIAMEILGVIKSPLRYEEAKNTLYSKANYIASMPLKSASDYKLPGWSVVGENPKQFLELNDETVIIDAGTLGEGNQSAKDLLQFLNEPTSSEKYISAFNKANANQGAPLYILTKSPYDTRATITSFYMVIHPESQFELRAYTLKFKRVGNFFQDQCAELSKLPAHRQVTECLMDLNKYIPTDSLDQAMIGDIKDTEKIVAAFNEVAKDFRQTLIYFYALNEESLIEVIRNYFIIDYSKVMIPHYDSLKVLRSTTGAFGLEPDLIGPTSKVAFWRKTNKIDPAVVRLYKAAQILAQNEWVFVGPNFGCGKGIITAKQYEETLGKNCYWTRVGYDFESVLYSALRKTHFYDYDKQTWLVNK